MRSSCNWAPLLPRLLRVRPPPPHAVAHPVEVIRDRDVRGDVALRPVARAQGCQALRLPGNPYRPLQVSVRLTCLCGVFPCPGRVVLRVERHVHRPVQRVFIPRLLAGTVGSGQKVKVGVVVSAPEPPVILRPVVPSYFPRGRETFPLDPSVCTSDRGWRRAGSFHADNTREAGRISVRPRRWVKFLNGYRFQPACLDHVKSANLYSD